MLMVVELSDSFPVELLPRVEIGQLPERGRFELVQRYSTSGWSASRCGDQ